MANESPRIRELWLAMVNARREGNEEQEEELREALSKERLRQWRHRPANLVRELEYRQHAGRLSDGLRVVRPSRAA